MAYLHRLLVALCLGLLLGNAHAQSNLSNLSNLRKLAMNTPLPLFYRELVAFDIDAHGALAFPDPAPDYHFAARTSVVPLLLHEVPLALRHYPLVFLPGDTKNPPTLAALVGIGDERNRFVETDGRWRRDTYLPAWVRRYPFIAVNAEGQSDPVLALDPQAEWIKQGGGERLIKDGKPTPRLEFIIAFQKEFQDFALRTKAVAKALQDAGVLEDGSLRIESPANDKTEQAREIKGFLTVSEQKLRALSAEAVARLHQADALGLAYAQLFSLANLPNVLTGTP
jgi:hypothetical protein